MTIETIEVTPESLETLYLRKENGEILLTESGKRIVVRRILPSYTIPVRLYDLELQLNENKREILLVDKDYLPQIIKEFDRLIKE